MLKPPVRLPKRPPPNIPEKSLPGILSESCPPLAEMEIPAPPHLSGVKPINARIRTHGIRVRHARELSTPAAAQVHVDDGRQGARGAVSVAGDGRVVVAVGAPEAGVVAAAAAGDCVAAEAEELGDYFAGGVYAE